MEQLEGKLVQTFKAKELGSLATNYAELGLDAFLKDGIAKDIPILGSLVGMAKVSVAIRDRLYFNKIVSFLNGVGQTTQEQREEFVRINCEEEKRFEATIMLILEQADRFEKTLLIGKVFKSCILGEITYEYALKLSHMVNRAFWHDLQQLIENENVQITEHNRSLVDAGLFEVTITGGGYRGRYNPANIQYNISDYGRALFRIANS